MPQRSFKSMFVELVSFLTLFALIGTMTSNFWERYLIQTELSNMKSSLHVLKETVHHIGVAYDDLHYELQGLADMKAIKSTKLKELPLPQRGGSNIFNTFRSMVKHEIMKMKNNNSGGNITPEGNDKSTRSSKLRGDDNSIGNTPSIGNDENVSISTSKGTNNHLRPQPCTKFDLKNASTTTKNALKSTGVDVDQNINRNLHENCNKTTIHRCCKDNSRCEYQYKCKF